MRDALRFAITCLLLICAFGISASALDVCVREKLKVKFISGRVVSPWRNTEAPIPGATVRLLKCRDNECHPVAEVKVDEEGRFAIENVPSGEYEIEATAIGFSPLTVGLKLNKSQGSKSKKEIIMILETLGSFGCDDYAEVRKIVR